MISSEPNDLISVIVPVYKVEPYLDRCVRSIVDQTYQNLEIILVDDGSPDNCPAMCDAWAGRDGRIRVIHKPNGGLSDARNAGMAAAAGEYIAFVDSDDWISGEFLELLHRAMMETEADLAACDAAAVCGAEEIPALTGTPCITAHTRQEAMADLARGKGFRAVAWNKLYKRSLLDNEAFPVGKLHEDEFFTYRVIDKCARLAYVDRPLYYYFQREGSIMTVRSARHLDALEAYLARQSLFRERYPALYLPDKIMFCMACADFYAGLGPDKTPEASAARGRIKEYRKQVRFSPGELARCTARELAYIAGSTPALIGIFTGLRGRREKR